MFERHQPNPWRYDSGARFLHGTARGVAAFELAVEAINAACRLRTEAKKSRH